MSPRKKNAKAKPHSLESVVRRELGIELDKEHQNADWGGELSPGMLEYAALDAQVLLPLADALGDKVRDAGLERVCEIEHRALRAMLWMAGAGFPFDVEGWKEYLKGINEEKSRLREELNSLVPERPAGGGWNWRSPGQVREALALVGVDLPSTGKKILSRCNHPLARTLLEYREASNLVSKYGPNLLDLIHADGRIYADWHQNGTATGRLSCSKPNLQNFPRKGAFRNYVRAPEGRVIVAADYSQIELRIAAKISRDKRMLEAYRRGEDLHAATARSLIGRGDVSKEQRDLAKAVNFGLLYGQGAQGLREYARDKHGIEMSLEEAKRYRRRFFETYPGLKAWHKWEKQQWKRGNAQTRTLSGRRRTGVRYFPERVNSPVQGTGADGLKLSLALLYERRHECPSAVLISCVHDEIVAECAEGDVEKVKAWLEKAMVDGMEEVLNGPHAKGPHVPVEVEVKSGRSWAGSE